MYSELNDNEKIAILKMSGAEVFTRSRKAHEEGKISNEKLKQMNAFWLNEHDIKRDKPESYRHKLPDGYSVNASRLSWESYK